MPYLKKSITLALLSTGLSTLTVMPVQAEEDTFFNALTGGKISFSARARYESVEQDNALKDANAFTVRSTLGYETAQFRGFSGKVEVEDVSEIGSDNFNSTTNGNTQYSVVADPNNTEVLQAYLAYNNWDTEFKYGRQEITHRDAPFHRFIGNVLWRQNHQSYDGFTLNSKLFDKTELSYGYINKRNTIFGDDRNAGIIRNGVVDMDSHLFRGVYNGFSAGTLEGYAYLLDFEDAPAIGAKTLGLRWNGGVPLNNDFSMIYTAEFARQDDYKDGTMDSQNYYLTEIGGKYKGWMAKLSYELQEGDGTDSFKTPLGTNHPFQGWADQFLSTPSQGLQDIYLTIVGKVLGAKVVGIYHDFETDKGSLDAGSEFNLLVVKKFMKHYTLGAAYADYNADSEFSSKVDTEKFWVWGQVNF
jgi:hypothetical protein